MHNTNDCSIQYRSAKLLLCELCPWICLAINSQQHTVYIMLLLLSRSSLLSPPPTTHTNTLDYLLPSGPSMIPTCEQPTTTFFSACDKQPAFIILLTIRNNCDQHVCQSPPHFLHPAIAKHKHLTQLSH